MWRYSRIAELDLDAWTPAAASPADLDAARHAAAGLVPGAVVVAVVGGAAAVDELPASWRERGVTVAAGADAVDEAGLGPAAIDAADADAFRLLNDAFAAAPVVVEVPRGVVLDEPLVVSTHVAGAGTAAFPRLVVRLGEGASLRLVEVLTSAGPVLVVPRTEVDLARGARLAQVQLQDLGADAWQLGSLVARVAQEADLDAALVGLGGAYARVRTDCHLAGRGANGDLRAAYFGEADQMLDYRTFQFHEAPDTTSDLLFKGAVGGRSRSVYTGLIRVEKEARGTSAFQTNRNVKLSDDAWAESVPNLEIETNDVRCSHASTVGPVDAEQRFYLESRGVPPAAADRLIVAGFFDEVVRALPAGLAAEAIRERIAAKLDRVAADLRTEDAS